MIQNYENNGNKMLKGQHVQKKKSIKWLSRNCMNMIKRKIIFYQNIKFNLEGCQYNNNKKKNRICLSSLSQEISQ